MNEHEESSWLSALVDGALDAQERSRVEEHLKGCPLCREELAALRQLKDRLSAAPRRAMPPDLIANLESGWNRPRLRVWAGMLAQAPARRWMPAAAFAAILAMGVWLGFFRHGTEAEVPIEVLAAAHSRYSAEALVPGDMVASNFSRELASVPNDN